MTEIDVQQMTDSIVNQIIMDNSTPWTFDFEPNCIISVGHRPAKFRLTTIYRNRNDDNYRAKIHGYLSDRVDLSNRKEFSVVWDQNVVQQGVLTVCNVDWIYHGLTHSDLFYRIKKIENSTINWLKLGF